MTLVDFRAIAKEKAGARWSRLDEPGRRVLIKAAKVAWLRESGGGDERESYADWLAAQPREVQEQTLGVTKAKLFRDGGLALDRFTDHGRPLTLEQLAETRPEAFTRAGLDPDDFKED